MRRGRISGGRARGIREKRGGWTAVHEVGKAVGVHADAKLRIERLAARGGGEKRVEPFGRFAVAAEDEFAVAGPVLRVERGVDLRLRRFALQPERRRAVDARTLGAQAEGARAGAPVRQVHVDRVFDLVGAHAVDADGDDIGEVHPEEFQAAEDDFARALGGELPVLELLQDAARFEVGKARRAHERGGPDDAGELVGGEETLLEVSLGLDVVANGPAVAHDGADVRRVDALGEEFCLGVLEMLFGEELVVVVVEVADGAPVLDLLRRLAEVARKGLHASAHIAGVQQQMRVVRCCREQALGLGEGKGHGFSFRWSVEAPRRPRRRPARRAAARTGTARRGRSRPRRRGASRTCCPCPRRPRRGSGFRSRTTPRAGRSSRGCGRRPCRCRSCIRRRP